MSLAGFSTTVLAWIGAHPDWAYFVLFTAALCESLAVVGMFIPGIAIMVGAGALIGTGAMEFAPACLGAIAGALIGDTLSYWLGHHYGPEIQRFAPMRRDPAAFARSSAWFARYGGMGVFCARFFGPTRAFMPVVAGALRMPFRVFFAINVLSALLWAPLYLLPGSLIF